MIPAAPGAGVGTVEVTPATLDITDLAPGAAVARDITVTNGSHVPVLVAVTHTGSGALFAGPAPLGLSTAWSSDAPTCNGLPVVGPGDTAGLALHVGLPADAGNEYQGLDGVAVVTVTATELPGGVCPSPGGVGPGPGDPSPTPGPVGPGGGGSDGDPATPPGGGSSGAGDVLAAPPGDALALTGAQAGSVLVTVVVLVAAGCALLRRRRHRDAPAAGSARPVVGA